jgi:hypothetical protein
VLSLRIDPVDASHDLARGRLAGRRAENSLQQVRHRTDGGQVGAGAEEYRSYDHREARAEPSTGSLSVQE